MARAGSTFGERFGYACWLYYLREGKAPAYAAIGRVAGRTGEAVGMWMNAKEPPSDFKVHEPAASFLGIDERWLFREEGEPPRPDLWEVWIAARSGKDQIREGAFMPDPRLDRKLSIQEEQRAVRVAEANAKKAQPRRSAKSSGRKGKGGGS